MVKIAVETVDKVAHECEIMKRSGKHFTKCTKSDLEKVVQVLLKQDALVEIPGRSYRHFENFMGYVNG
jgi:hypothetical protein